MKLFVFPANLLYTLEYTAGQLDCAFYVWKLRPQDHHPIACSAKKQQGQEARCVLSVQINLSLTLTFHEFSQHFHFN